MKIYKLTVSKLQDNNMIAIPSSYITPKTLLREYYYLSEELAHKEAQAQYGAAFILFGHQHGLVTDITEIEIIQ